MYGHWAIGAYHMEDRIHLVKCPTLLIVGKKDHFAMREKNRIFPKILPRSEEVFVEDGSIFLPTQLPETFAKLVMDFLDKKS
jgi:pimeloyl-ACP methyl ester carboxylesterase